MGQSPFGNGAGFSRFAATGIPSQLAVRPKSFPVNRLGLQSRRGTAAWGLEGSSRSGRNQYVMSQREERAALPEDSQTFL